MDPSVTTAPLRPPSPPPPVPPAPDTGPLDLRIKRQRDSLAANHATIAALKKEAARLKEELHYSSTSSVKYCAWKGPYIKATGWAARDPVALLNAIPFLPSPPAPNGINPRALDYEPENPTAHKVQPAQPVEHKAPAKVAKTMAEHVVAKVNGGEGKGGAQGSGEESKRGLPVTPKTTFPPLPSILLDNSTLSPSGPLPLRSLAPSKPRCPPPQSEASPR